MYNTTAQKHFKINTFRLDMRRKPVDFKIMRQNNVSFVSPKVYSTVEMIQCTNKVMG